MAGSVFVLATLAQLAGVTDAIDRRIGDALARAGSPRVLEPTQLVPDVAVVTIDPRSLRALPAWPWPRGLHAQAIERLESAGARAIAFDIDFSSPAQDASEDTRLADASRTNGHVVFATFSQRQSLEGGAELEVVNRPIPSLETAAAALGSVLVPIDPDGVVRHAPRESPIAGRPIRSLARAALRVAAAEALHAWIDRSHEGASLTHVDWRRIEPAMPTVAFVDVVEGRFDPALIDGRTVFIGATAAEFQDLWATPAEPALPGVMIQALAYRTAAAEAAGDDVLVPMPMPWIVAGYLLLALATGPASRLGGRGRAALCLGTAAGWVAGGWALLWYAGLVLPISVGLGLVGLRYTLGIEALQRRMRERADAQESSLVALARIGSTTRTAEGEAGAASGNGLELALELLGEVVSARGLVLLRASPSGDLQDERLEWRPSSTDEEPLIVDSNLARKALDDHAPIDSSDPFAPGAPVIYSPLSAGGERIGVLVVFGHPDQRLDRLQRRTIATVGAQLALTAQNLQLIERLRETFESSIAAVASAVEARDGYTDQHCRRLAAFSSLMGRRLGMDEEEIRAMELGALLHDVGKIGIPDAILNKPGHLSGDERRQMQQHPEIGAGIVAPVVGLSETTLHCVVHHHERWDGTGYPEGLEAEEIPLAARIVAIVDVWDALSSDRPYKSALSQPEVRDLLMKGRGRQFDPQLVDLFFEVLHEQGEEMLELIAHSSSQGSPA